MLKLWVWAPCSTFNFTRNCKTVFWRRTPTSNSIHWNSPSSELFLPLYFCYYYYSNYWGVNPGPHGHFTSAILIDPIVLNPQSIGGFLPSFPCFLTHNYLMGVCVYATQCLWRSEDNLHELVLLNSGHQDGIASTFTYWTLLLCIPHFFFDFLKKLKYSHITPPIHFPSSNSSHDTPSNLSQIPGHLFLNNYYYMHTHMHMHKHLIVIITCIHTYAQAHASTHAYTRERDTTCWVFLVLYMHWF